MNSSVIHPKHYNIPGRKECIVEMREKFGDEKVENFCELNSYKYQYRHEEKNGQEDIDKANNYADIRAEIIATDKRFVIAEQFGLEAQRNQLIEEMSELTQSICKWNRKCGLGVPLDQKWTVHEIESSIIEELADVKLVLEQVIHLMECEDDVQKVMEEKIERTLERMGEK